MMIMLFALVALLLALVVVRLTAAPMPTIHRSWTHPHTRENARHLRQLVNGSIGPIQRG